MFKYEYIKIYNEALMSAKFTQHREIIDKYAKKGYRYIGFIPTKTDGYGRFRDIDLIFEIEIKE
ncbi:MAG: DUF4177 domain-containing protein [Oscillospiraceae bacterium]|nr:DUF4177 domain-containing protein [Oscillospiraceae bacterium]